MPLRFDKATFTSAGQNNTPMVNPGRYGDNAMAGSRTGAGAKNTGRYGDNALTGDVAITEDAHEAKLDMLQSILNDADISDEEIKRDLELSVVGQRKIAARLAIRWRDVPELISALKLKLEREPHGITEAAGNRFTYEPDFLNNVTIRDAQTGAEEFLHGQAAIDLLARLKSDPGQEQLLLGRAIQGAGATMIGEAIDDDADAIDLGTGTYNFPWSIDGQHGTATAEFSGYGESFHVEIVDVRNAQGEGIAVDDAMAATLRDAAIAYIPNA